jgi:hypothetical protein
VSKRREPSFFNRQNDGRDKRSFSKTQKGAIYEEQQGLYAGECCGHSPVDHRIVEYHHVEKWAEGGKTNIQNGIAVCPNCNAWIHYYANLKKQKMKDLADDEDEKTNKSTAHSDWIMGRR